MEIVKFRREHLEKLELQDAQADMREQLKDPAYGLMLEQCRFSFTGIHDGVIIGCAGIQEVWEGRAIMWALLSKHAGVHFRSIHRAAMGFITQSEWRRIECVVEDGFDAGHRWAKLLGMEREGLMRKYSPTGVDFHLYSRIK